MLNIKEKENAIYALEEWAKELEAQHNIGKRNEIYELIWKLSSSLGGKPICGDHLVIDCGCL